MTQPTGYEYGVLLVRFPDAPHRSGMTKEEAEEWIREWDEMDGKVGAFVLIRRTLGPWENVSPA